SQLICSDSIASQTRYSVIIFVMLAGGSASSGFLAYKILPVSASTKIAESALTSNVCACDTSGHDTIKDDHVTSIIRVMIQKYMSITLIMLVTIKDAHVTRIIRVMDIYF